MIRKWSNIMRPVIYLLGKNIIHFIDQVISIQLDHQIDKECATHHYDSLKLSFMLEIALSIILVREDRSEWPLQF